MQITCPNCRTSYEIAEAAIGSDGRLVRCARCRTEWRCFRTDEAGPEDDIFTPDRPADSDDVPASVFDEVLTDDMLADIHGESATTPAAASEPPKSQTPAGQASRKGGPVLRRKPRKPLPWKAFGMAAAVGALVAVPLAREPVVRLFPETAMLYASIGLPVNLRGLDIENVTTRSGAEGGMTVLVVEGMITNITDQEVPLPRLRLAVRDQSSHELYNWTAVVGRATLAPGETAPFRSRLAAPPAEGRSVEVRFLSRRDLTPGQR